MELGEMRVGDREADLFACGDLLIACFRNPPGGVHAQHMYRLTFESDVFLLAAFRIYLDRTGKVAMPEIDLEREESLQC
jgi:hypothetical protein